MRPWNCFARMQIKTKTTSGSQLLQNTWIIKQTVVLLWKNWRKYGSVSYSFRCWVRNIEEIKNHSLQTWQIIKLNDWKSLWSFFDNLKDVKEVVLSEKTDARVAKNYLNKAFKAHTAQNVGNVTKWCELSGNAKCFEKSEKLRNVVNCQDVSWTA